MASLGLGPTGSPLKACRQCGRAIPWPRVHSSDPYRRRWERPDEYDRRQFCQRACHGASLKGQPRAPRRSLAGILPNRPHPPVPATEAPGRQLGRLRAEITSCPKCRATALVAVEVGLRCLTCGKVIYTADADFRAELYRPYRSVLA